MCVDLVRAGEQLAGPLSETGAVLYFRERVMDEGKLLLRAVLETPADNTVRLVYADFLQDHGDEEEATFIRQQVAWKESEPSRSRLQTVQSVLGPANRCRVEACTWKEAVIRSPRRGVAVHFRRGFAEVVGLPIDLFLREGVAADLFSLHPVTQVELTDRITSYWLEHPDQTFFCQGPASRGGSYIPPCLFEFLPCGFQGCADDGLGLRRGARPYKYRFYLGGEPEAFSALSLACVRYGRREAGIPDLPEHRNIPKYRPGNEAYE